MAALQDNGKRAFPDLKEMLYAVTGIYTTCVAFHEKKHNFYQHISFGRVREDVEALGTALATRLPRSPRVLVVGKNGYALACAYLALLCGTGLPVLADAGLSAAELEELAREAAVNAVLFDDGAADKVKGLASLVSVPFSAFGALIKSGKAAVAAGDVCFRTKQLDPEAPAALFYTAGTTGHAKGVLLSHKNILTVLAALTATQHVTDADIFLSVLPLSHVYECVLGLLFPFSRGASVAFGEGIGCLMRNMREIHPTCMVTVPYLAERIYHKFWALVAKGGNEAAVRRAIAVSDPVRPLSARAALKSRLLAEARAPFGGALSTMLVVGDYLPAEVSKGLRQIGIFAAQGYGVTECAGLVAIGTEACYRDGTVGVALPDTTVDIFNKQPDGSGEIRVRGEHVMLGYDGDGAHATALPNGWYYTGDFGRIDADGFLHVIGRRENCIERADGTLVSPEELEQLLCQSPLVADAVVVGVPDKEAKDYEIAALLLPNTAYAAELFGVDCTTEELEEAIGEWLCEINKTLPTATCITLFALGDAPFPRNAAGRVLRAEVAKTLEAAKNQD